MVWSIKRIFKKVGLIFRECNTDKNNQYETLKLGTTTGLFILIVLEVLSIFLKFSFSAADFSLGYTSILAGYGLTAGAKKQLENTNGNS